ncbi:MAG: hypothetical protein HIU86_08655 [Acidobacteria bacterium]|nr:hypothetical protein [Acidobacteriota bacterium]
MRTRSLAAVDPWRIEIITVVGGSRTSGERAALSRHTRSGLLLRLCPGGYVEREAFESLTPEQQHVVRIRALASVSPMPLVVSHWSAAVLHGLPVLRSRLDAVHITVADDSDRRRQGLASHRHPIDDGEVVRRGDLLVTTIGRTVVDIAGSAPLEEGVIAVDAALLSGVPREALEAAADRAGARRSARRIRDTVAFGHPGAESAAESRMRVSVMRNGFEVPVLQHRIRLAGGSQASLDGLLRRANVGIEVDGVQKYVDAQMAPDGAAKAVLAEKRREDEVRLGLRALVRPGWAQSGSAVAMRALLAHVGVRPTLPRTPFAEYCAAARSAQPRRRPH